MHCSVQCPWYTVQSVRHQWFKVSAVHCSKCLLSSVQCLSKGFAVLCPLLSLSTVHGLFFILFRLADYVQSRMGEGAGLIAPPPPSPSPGPPPHLLRRLPQFQGELAPSSKTVQNRKWVILLELGVTTLQNPPKSLSYQQSYGLPAMTTFFGVKPS